MCVRASQAPHVGVGAQQLLVKSDSMQAALELLVSCCKSQRSQEGPSHKPPIDSGFVPWDKSTPAAVCKQVVALWGQVLCCRDFQHTTQKKKSKNKEEEQQEEEEQENQRSKKQARESKKKAPRPKTTRQAQTLPQTQRASERVGCLETER